MDIDKGTVRTIAIGGLTKPELLNKLQKNSIALNHYADLLFADDRFILSESKQKLTTVELSAADLGFPDGATIPRINAEAFKFGLRLCPLELGPYLRLHVQDQPEGAGRSGGERKTNQAPDGSITIASLPLTEDPEFPRGFYIRRIDGVLWLRGYRADDTHVWNAHDRFVFCR